MTLGKLGAGVEKARVGAVRVVPQVGEAVLAVVPDDDDDDYKDDDDVVMMMMMMTVMRMMMIMMMMMRTASHLQVLQGLMVASCQLDRQPVPHVWQPGRRQTAPHPVLQLLLFLS